MPLLLPRGRRSRSPDCLWRASSALRLFTSLAAGQPTHPHQEGTNAFSRIPGDPISIYFTRCTLKPMLSVIPRSPRLGCGEHAACGSVAGWGRNYLRQDQNCYGISVHSVDLQGMEETELINTALFTNCSLQKTHNSSNLRSDLTLRWSNPEDSADFFSEVSAWHGPSQPDLDRYHSGPILHKFAQL